MGSEVEQKFTEFKWAESESWQKYFADLFPTPNAQKVQKFKRKWYKANVDANLSEEEPQSSATATSTAAPSPSNATTTNTATSGTSATTGTTGSFPGRTASQSGGAGTSARSVTEQLWTRSAAFLLSSGAFLYLSSFLIAGLQGRLRVSAVVCLCLGFIASLIAAYGKPQWDAQYWQLIAYHEAALALPSCLIALPQDRFIFYAPALLSAFYLSIDYLAEFVGSLPLAPTPFKNALSNLATGQQKEMVRTYRGKLDVYCGLTAIALFILQRIRFLFLMLTFQMLRHKYVVSPHTKRAFADVHTLITRGLSHPMVPPAVNNTYQRFSAIISRYANPPQ